LRFLSQELSKNTPDTILDKKSLSIALGKIVVVVNRINAAKSKTDSESESDKQKRHLIEVLILNAVEKQVLP